MTMTQKDVWQGWRGNYINVQGLTRAVGAKDNLAGHVISSEVLQHSGRNFLHYETLLCSRSLRDWSSSSFTFVRYYEKFHYSVLTLVLSTNCSCFETQRWRTPDLNLILLSKSVYLYKSALTIQLLFTGFLFIAFWKSEKVIDNGQD